TGRSSRHESYRRPKRTPSPEARLTRAADDIAVVRAADALGEMRPSSQALPDADREAHARFTGYEERGNYRTGTTRSPSRGTPSATGRPARRMVVKSNFDGM